MADNGCGCTEDNCPHKTSEVTLFDGTFNNITVPAGSSLNDVLLLLESYTTNAAANCNTSYVLDAFSACLDLPGGTYSFQQIIQAIINKLCSTSSELSALQEQVDGITSDPSVNTTEVSLDGIILPPCFAAFVGVTNTDLLNVILNAICKLQDTTVILADDDNDNSFSSRAMSLGVTRDFVYGLIDNKSYVYEETTPTVSPTSFSTSIEPIKAIVNGYLVAKTSQHPISTSPNEDMYVNLRDDGAYVEYTGAVGFFPPAFPANQISLYRFRTDGAGIINVSVQFGTDPFNPTPLGVDDVTTVNILDGAVTSPKMDDVIVGSTEGHPSIFELTVNDKGRVTAVNSNIDFAGIVNGQKLIYNLAQNRFDAVDDVNIPAAGEIPIANPTADNYIASALKETTDNVLSTKKVEINLGPSELQGEALLNVAAVAGDPGGILFPRMTAVDASSLTGIDGLVIYLTSIDATFISVGFWGMEAGVWIKL